MALLLAPPRHTIETQEMKIIIIKPEKIIPVKWNYS